MHKKLSAAAIAIILSTVFAEAGPVRDFDESFADAYASYRMALFATNSGDTEKSNRALDSFSGKWTRLATNYLASPPPQYEDDPLWPQTLSSVEASINEAKTGIENNKLPAAHKALETIRDEVGALHERNGIEKFSDRMNAYHTQMEHVLGMNVADLDEAALKSLLEQAAILSFLSKDILRQPPVGISSEDKEYSALANGFKASVNGFLSAARSGNPELLKKAIGGLKVPYSKFFLKFG